MKKLIGMISKCGLFILIAVASVPCEAAFPNENSPSLPMTQWAKANGISDETLKDIGMFLTHKGEWKGSRDKDQINQRSKLFLGHINREEFKRNPQKALMDALCEARAEARDLSAGEICGQNKPLEIPTEVPGFISLFKVVPNVSNGSSPIHIQLLLDQEARLKLSIFAVSGEQVFATTAIGHRGQNQLVWDSKTPSGQVVASGLYVYILQARGTDGRTQTKTGKIVIVR